MRLTSPVSSSPLLGVTVYAGAFLGILLCSGVDAQNLTEAGEAAVEDPVAECTAYYYAPSGSQISLFPPIWQTAFILPNDTAAQAKWSSIAGSIPNIAPKGGTDGNFSNVTYTASDPDCWWTYDKCVTPKLAGLPVDVYNVPEPKTLGLGFDDGPNCSHNAFYDYLTSQQQKATMFYIGSNVMDWPLQAQRAITDGHEVCVHTWSHRYMTAFSSPDAFAELYYTSQAIKLVTGVTPTCWRPPYGDIDDRIRAIANALGLRTIIWTYDSNDWKAVVGTVPPATVDASYQSLIDSANNGTFDTAGTIILTHELANFTMAEAVKFYPQLKTAFKYLVPVGVSLNKTQPYVEPNYALPTFQQYINGTVTVVSNVTVTTSSTTIPSGTAASTSRPSASGQSKPNGAAMGLAAGAAVSVTMGLLATLFGTMAVFIGS